MRGPCTRHATHAPPSSRRQLSPSCAIAVSLKHHPDKGGDPAKFHKITEAYEVLCSLKAQEETLEEEEASMGPIFLMCVLCYVPTPGRVMQEMEPSGMSGQEWCRR